MQMACVVCVEDNVFALKHLHRPPLFTRAEPPPSPIHTCGAPGSSPLLTHADFPECKYPLTHAEHINIATAFSLTTSSPRSPTHRCAWTACRRQTHCPVT